MDDSATSSMFDQAIDTILFVLAMSVIIVFIGSMGILIHSVIMSNHEKTTIMEIQEMELDNGYTNMDTGEFHYDGIFSGAEVYSNILNADASYDIKIGNHVIQMTAYRFDGKDYNSELEYYQIENASALMNKIDLSCQYVRKIKMDGSGSVISVEYTKN